MKLATISKNWKIGITGILTLAGIIYLVKTGFARALYDELWGVWRY